MNLYHLKYFIDAVENGSLSKSAEINHVTHSAVSQAIRSLGDHLGTPLLTHTKKHFQLTQAAKDALPRLKQLLFDFQAIQNQITQQKNEPSGELTIWVPQSLLVDRFLKVIESFKKKFPQITLKVQTGATYLIRQGLLSEKCHLGIAVDDSILSQFPGEFLDRGKFVLVGKKQNHNIHHHDIITTHNEKSEVALLKSEYNKNYDKHLELKTFILSWGAIKEYIKQSPTSIGYLPEYVAKKELEKKELFVIPFKGKLPNYQIKAVWHQSRPLNPNAELFLTELKHLRG